MRTTKTHVYFWFGLFSNWSNSPFYIGECRFANVEQAFMLQKALYFFDTETAEKILQQPNPNLAKGLGRLVKNYNDSMWNEVRLSKMVFVNEFKYQQNQKHRELLLNSGPRLLVEASPMDKVWGVGLGRWFGALVWPRMTTVF